MEVFLDLGIKIPNAVLVEGMSVTKDNEIVFEFLKEYGKISKFDLIADVDSDFNDTLVIEYCSGSALEALRPSLPYTLVSADHVSSFCISDLSTVCASRVAKSRTLSYLSELKDLARLSGTDFVEVMAAMMSQIGHSVAALQPLSQAKEQPEDTKDGLTDAGDQKQATPSPVQHRFSNPASHQTPHSSPSGLNLNPPEVQRYVVEHIVKSEDTTQHQRLKQFSGRLPRPNHEVDYDIWRTGVDLLMRDPSVSDFQRSRKIIDSLLPPAADIIKHLKPDTPPVFFLETLDSAFATVQDGDELFAKFMDTFQNAGEKPSMYLQRLQVSLISAVKRGGAAEPDIPRHLLNQFCRGCWDNNLISELNLKQKKTQPPTFAELLLLLRTEEDREAAKALRMKQHLGATRQKVSSHAQLVRKPEEKEAIAQLTSITQQLAQQLADVQKQLTLLTANQSATHLTRSKPETYTKQPRRVDKPQAKRDSQAKPGYCFRCGEDGHIRPQCDNQPNPSLVAKKKKQFEQKRQTSQLN